MPNYRDDIPTTLPGIEINGRPLKHLTTTEQYLAIPQERAQLIVLVGSGAGRTYTVEDEIVIGRVPEAGIRISSDDVSRRHARVRRTAQNAFVVEDLGSRNGTLVNGVPVKEQELSPGDKIRVGGKTVLMFICYDPLEDQILQSQKLEALGQLAGGVAHDFNNLLGAILANVSFLQSLPPATTLEPRQVQECLRDMELAAQRAGQLTKQLLGFARRDTRQVQNLDAASLLREVRHLASRTFDQGIQITVETPPDLVVVGDPSQLHQVLMNLCINARDAMPEGGTLSLSAECMMLSEEQVITLPFLVPGAYVVITVKDTGQGMSDEVHRHIFEPFFTTKGAGRGTGMGLSIAYGIIKNHGGHITAESRPGQGAVFRIYLPAGDPLGARTATPTVRTVKGVTPGGGGTILVVEDEEILRNGTRRLLEGVGFTVLCAGDGEQAVSLFRGEGARIDLVLLDMVMPKMGGVETFHEIRRIKPSVKVLLTSGYTEQTTVQALLTAGAEGFLPKPYDAATLMQSLSQLLAGKVS
jgi:signal transduction histidine kinase/CheY-like chemotaxis protein